VVAFDAKVTAVLIAIACFTVSGYRIIDASLLDPPDSKTDPIRLSFAPFPARVSDELRQLMLEQIESLKKQTFGGLSREELSQQEARLKRIREVSADFFAALKRQSQ
jgi:hypothetical protein